MNQTVDWVVLSEQVGVSLPINEHAKKTLNFQHYYQLLELTASQLQASGFYLQLGNSYDITDLGVLGYALLSAENLRQSWNLTFHTTSLLMHPLSSRRMVREGRVVVELLPPAHTHGDLRYLYEEWLTGTWKWVCQRLPQVANSSDLTIKLAYSKPVYAERYKEFFPGKILFDQPLTELSFPEHWYELRCLAANPSAARLCQQQWQVVSAQMNQQTDLVEQVRRILLLNPQCHFPTQVEMAEQFRLPPHTFHRRLLKDGMRYKNIVIEVRMELAKNYLEITVLPLLEISYLLGYEHPPSFYRAFKKWYGFTPQSWREKASSK